MPEYLARYTVKALMYDGAWMPDPEPHKPEFRFEAKNDFEARKIAEEHMDTFEKDYFHPIPTLDQILKVEDVLLKPKQLELF